MKIKYRVMKIEYDDCHATGTVPTLSPQVLLDVMHENAEDRVIEVLNEMIKRCKPFTYEDFNYFIQQKNNELIDYEATTPEVGLTFRPASKYGYDHTGMTTLSMIATITDILCGKRLAFKIDNDDYITGVMWHEKK